MFLFYKIYRRFKNSFDNCFPSKTVKINPKSIRSPYITTALISSIKEKKNRLEKLAFEWLITFKEQYGVYRNKLTFLLKAAKKKYYQDQLTSNQGNPKSHWKSINNILGRSTDSKHQTIEVHPPSTEIPNRFNDHFLNVGEQNHVNVRNYFMQYLHNPPNYSIYLSPTSQTEVKKYLTAMKSFSSGIDDIPPMVLKHAANIISLPLTFIINLTLKTGIFPDRLKYAKVVLLFKFGNRTNINNYRPISIPPAVIKIFEKIITSRLVNDIEKNHLLSDFQHWA